LIVPSENFFYLFGNKLVPGNVFRVHVRPIRRRPRPHPYCTGLCIRIQSRPTVTPDRMRCVRLLRNRRK
jgi:hypothetical protein